MLFVIVALFVAIAGIALANAISSSNSSVSDTAATQEPTPPPTSGSPTPKPTRATPTATKTATAAETASPSPVKTPRDRHTAEPVTSPKPTPKPTTTATADCPSAATRMSRARASLRHPSALPQASVITAGPRSGTLGTADLAGGTITLYLRSCAEESVTRLAVVWMYEAGQFLAVQSWDAAKQDRWRQLRGARLRTTTEMQQDVAAVFAYWQTGSTEAWQSPVAPPAPSRLAQLAPYLQQ